MIICDCHCDTLYSMQMGRDQHLDVTMENLRAGGVSLQTMAMYVGPGRKGDVEALMQGMLQKLALLKSQAEADSRFIMAIQKCSTPVPMHSIVKMPANRFANRTIIRISKHYTKNISANP